MSAWVRSEMGLDSCSDLRYHIALACVAVHGETWVAGECHHGDTSRKPIEAHMISTATEGKELSQPHHVRAVSTARGSESESLSSIH